MKRKLLALALGLCLFAGAAFGCGGGDDPESSSSPQGPTITDGIVEKTSEHQLAFVSSDEGLSAFLNDYFQRHVGVDGKKVVELDVGQGGTAWKEWEAMSLMWFDSTSTSGMGRLDGYDLIRSALTDTAVDRYGYVWSSGAEADTPDTADSFTYFDQGWPFPSFEHSGSRQYGFGNNFNQSSDLNDNWYAEGATASISGGNVSLSANSGQTEIRLTAANLQGYAFFAPFVETEIKISSNGGDDQRFGDLRLEWTTADGQSHSVTYSEAGTQDKTLNTQGAQGHYYFNMSTVEGWGRTNDVCDVNGSDPDAVITSMTLVIPAAQGKNLNGVTVLVDFLRSDYDDRCVQNNAIYLNAAAEYYRYTGDDDFLESILVRCRRIFQFYLTYCGGESGLIHQDNFVGHDGIPASGHGISSGYFDIIALPSVDFYFNVYFYKAVQSMEYLERMAAAADITVGEASVLTPDMQGTETYDQTAESLAALAETCKAEISDYFWSEEKGRFVEGYVDWEATGHLNGSSNLGMYDDVTASDTIDYGFLAFNLEAVACGLADEEQEQAIMDWLTGEQTVSGDTSTGEDIYYFECVPRFSAVENRHQYSSDAWTAPGFGQQVQDGGSCMWITYYDLMSRAGVLGADDLYARTKEIQTWYEKVKAAYDRRYPEDDNPTQFYRAYYSTQLAITLQGGGQAGGLGLDSEFLENAIVYSAFPKAILGMDSDEYNNISFTPSLPSELEYFKMENLVYQYVKYDCIVGHNYLRISDVTEGAVGDGRGTRNGLTVTVRLPAPEGDFYVFVDNVAVSNYTVEDGCVTLTLPFQDCYVLVREA